MDMAGKTCVVTGASAGIGTATALGLAARRASLALVGRDRGRLDDVARRCKEAGSPEVQVYRCDFAVLDEVTTLAASLLEDLPRIDVLVNNAALVLQRREETVDGFEKTFAVNHLAPYLLTRLLLDRLVASAPARVVNVSSDAHTFGPLDPADYMSTQSYKPLRVYGRSKVANILFTVELASRLEGTGVTVNCLHPGFVSTSLGRDNKLGLLFVKLASPFIKKPADGAATVLLLAADEVAESGAYFIGRGVATPRPWATDPDLARRLWDDSAQLVGLS